MLLQQEILLRPTPDQARKMAQYAGYARWAYNDLRGAMLAAVGVGQPKEWDPDELDAYLRENIELIPSVDAVRKERIPLRPEWARQLKQYAYHAAAHNLKAAFRRFAQCNDGKHNGHAPKTCGFPRLHKRGRNESFEPCDTHSENLRVVCRPIDPDDGSPLKNPVASKYIEMPGIGKVRMTQPLREVCWPKQVVVKRRGNRWFASVLYENGKDLPEAGSQDGPVVGVDAGLKTLAFCSDGRQFLNPRPLAQRLRELRFVDKAIARSRNLNPNWILKPSQRLLKLYARRRRLYEQVADARKDTHRQVASAIAKSAGVVVVESLTLGGLLKNRNLARSLSDAGLGGLLAEIKWQCAKRGVRLIEAPRNYASTQICARCGGRPERRLTLSARIYRCGHCGWVADRDYNAALNLAALAPAYCARLNQRVEDTETRRPSDRRDPVKREPLNVDQQSSLWPAAALQ